MNLFHYLASGEVKDFSLKFVIAPSIREIENKLIQEQRPVAISLPGYIVPMNEKSNLFIKYPNKIANITVYPEDALTIKRKGDTNNGWSHFEIEGRAWVRARLSVIYEDKHFKPLIISD